MMRKSILVTLTAALLLTAVLCTAGCVEAPSDEIVGTYVAETDSSVSYAVFENGGTDCFVEAVAAETETGEDAWVLTGTCSWAAAEPKGTYTLTFADGETETAVFDAEHGLMTIGEVVYQKYPSGYSGCVGFMIPGDLGEQSEPSKTGWQRFI
ncbi:MAG TPA: hypothetical protein O0Y08_04570 [Methanocorpusculum sp.]|nr:hypothetical protein [Methanocorpusculum sp.]